MLQGYSYKGTRLSIRMATSSTKELKNLKTHSLWTGRINDVVRTLGQNGINMHAFSMAETTDFGILRLIVSDVDKAVEVLRAQNFAVMSTEVICLSCDNTPGSLAIILEYLAEEKIFIEYMYAFAQNDKAHVVIKPNDIKACLAVLEAKGCTVLRKGDL